MKRKNPITGTPFKRGDLSYDGKVFYRYRDWVSNGLLAEEWITPKELEFRRNREVSKRPSRQGLYAAKRDKINDLKIGKKRLNPATGVKFGNGFHDPNTGLIFRNYEYQTVCKDGYFGERWITLEKYNEEKTRKKIYKTTYQKGLSFEQRLKNSIRNSKKRALDNGREFSVSTKYLISIYPKDHVCPVLGTKMVFGGDRENSPSLDRIDNAKGYVAGNVVWMSYRANFLKGNSNPDEILALADWLQAQNLY